MNTAAGLHAPTHTDVHAYICACVAAYAYICVRMICFSLGTRSLTPATPFENHALQGKQKVDDKAQFGPQKVKKQEMSASREGVRARDIAREHIVHSKSTERAHELPCRCKKEGLRTRCSSLPAQAHGPHDRQTQQRDLLGARPGQVFAHLPSILQRSRIIPAAPGTPPPKSPLSFSPITPQPPPHGGREKGATAGARRARHRVAPTPCNGPRAPGARLHKTHPVSSTATAFRFGAIPCRKGWNTALCRAVHERRRTKRRDHAFYRRATAGPG